MTGARDQQVVITPDPAKLAASGVAPTAIGAALQANGVAIPAGTLVDGGQARTVQIGTRIATIEDLRGIFVTPTTPGAAPVKLSDVATVDEQIAAATAFTRTNGKDSLGIQVTAAPDGNAVQISHEIRDKLADLRHGVRRRRSPWSSTRRRTWRSRSRA